MRVADRFAVLVTTATLILGNPIGPRHAAAQEGSLRQSVQSPTAASLGRFGDVPVSAYTGSPDVSIPLFVLQGRTFELPLTLEHRQRQRYQGGGIRVEQIASWVGLGWALDAGGTVTRTVRGISDDLAGGYYNTGQGIDIFYDDDNLLTPDDTLLTNIANGVLDTEPDHLIILQWASWVGFRLWEYSSPVL